MLRKSLIAAGILFAVLVVAAVALVTLVDVNRFKPRIEQFVQDRYQRSLRMDGDLSLSLFPRIALSLPSSTLSEPGGAGEAASLAGARVSVAVMPLLRGQIVAEKVTLAGVKATVERRADGSLSIDDLLGRGRSAVTVFPAGAARPDPQAASPAPDAPAAPAPATSATPGTPGTPGTSGTSGTPPGELPRFEIGGIGVTDGQVVFRDQQTGNTLAISGLALDTGPIANQGETPLKLQMAFSSTRPQASGHLDLQAVAQIDLDRNRFGATGLEANLDAVSGTTRLEASRFRLASLSFDPGAMALDLRGLDLNARGSLADAPFEASLGAPRLALTETSAAGDTLQAAVKLAGVRITEARLQASGVGGTSAALTVAKLSIDATTRQGARTVQAKLGSPVKANLPAGVVEFPALAGTVLIDDPDLPGKTAAIELVGSASADTRQEAIDANLQAKAQGTTLVAKVDVRGFDKPKIGFDVSADLLDVDRYFPAGPAAALAGGSAGAPGPGGVPGGEAGSAAAGTTGGAAGGTTRGAAGGTTGGAASGTTGGAPGGATGGATGDTPGGAGGAGGASGPDAPIDLSALADLDLHGRLSIAELQARGVRASQVQATVKAAAGRLDVTPVNASLYGGRLAATAGVTAGATPAANRFDATAKLTGISIGPLLKDVADEDLLEGRGNLTMALTAGGGTLDDLKRGLDGTAALNLRDGAIKGINLGETIRSTRSLLQGGGRTETRASDASKKTDFTELSVSFVIADGIASSNDLDAKSPLLRLAGAGRADLVASRLDYTVRASVVGTSTGQGGKALDEVRGVTIPVKLAGPFDNPDWQIDWETAGKEALKSRATAEIRRRLKTDDIEGKAKEELGDALKGLFKR